MDVSYSFRWALIYRLIALLSLLAGVVLVVLGFLAGFQGAITTLIADPLDPGPAIERANPSITVAFCILALVVWQFGKTYALFLTLPRAAGRAAAKRFDPNRVSSAVTADLDERLSAIEADVAETRRKVEALERDGRVATYDEDENYRGDETEDRAPTTDSSDRSASDSDRRSASDRSESADRSPSTASTGSTAERTAREGAGDGSDPLADGDLTSESTFERD